MSHDKKKAKKVIGQAQVVAESVNPEKISVPDIKSSSKGQSRSKK
nr:hypothetical protein [uncultured Methanospirillum sp.]